MKEEDLKYEATSHVIVKKGDYDLLTQLSAHPLDDCMMTVGKSEISTWFPLKGGYYVKWTGGLGDIESVFILMNTRSKLSVADVNMEEFFDDICG